LFAEAVIRRAIRSAMQSKKNQTRAVTAPLVKELAKRRKAEFKISLPASSVDSKPLKPTALYQDAGNGYNGNFTFPQR
jgi:hypothetical protein